MKNYCAEITENIKIAKDVYKMTLNCSGEGVFPGQFINIKVESLYLRRPISVCDFGDDFITVIYKVVGKGTDIMSTLKVGDKVDILTQLGHGFDLEKDCEKPLLIGGGVGTPPMYALAKALIAKGKDVTVCLGFNTADEVFLKEEFEALGCKTLVATLDGSGDHKGFVTDMIKEKDIDFDYYYSCGPAVMLKAVQNTLGFNGQISMEERMACGFGACVGCTIHTKSGAKQVCKDGPVFDSSEIEL